MSKTAAAHPITPDRRYFVVRGRLWRLTDPSLDPERHGELVRELMTLRRSLRDLPFGPDRTAARKRLDGTKIALGERGPVWWDDGSPDYNRRMAKNTPYADWYAGVVGEPC